MTYLQQSDPEFNSALIVALQRPRIEAARDGWGVYVIRGSHGWLFADRRQALEEHRALVEMERSSPRAA